MKRGYTAAKNENRCKASITVGKVAKEGAQCMRAAKIDGLCKQHELKRHAGACAVRFLIDGKSQPCDCKLDPSFDPTAGPLRRN